MARRITHADIIEALGQRYDYYSARNILQDALAQAGMSPAEDYAPEEASRIVWGLNCLGERAQAAAMAMLELVGEAATADLPEDDDPDEAWGPEEEAMAAAISAMVQQELARQVSQVRSERRAPAPGTAPPPAGEPEGGYWN